jgi:HAD superfamily hydrolase (TIGR01509 family)
MQRFVFDLDGTLIDSVYQHVLAWREALEGVGLSLAVWRIHRRIGMSGGLLMQALGREIGHRLTAGELEQVQKSHAAAFERRCDELRPLPGAIELLRRLCEVGVPHAIATSGRSENARASIEALQVGPEVPVITREDVQRAKPDPDLFLAAARRLNVSMSDVVVVGDSVWDLLAARRGGSLGVGLLSGGYGEEELQQAGAYRV